MLFLRQCLLELSSLGITTGLPALPTTPSVDAADNRIGGCAVILPPWFNRMGEFEPYRVGDLVKVTLINGRGYIDGSGAGRYCL